MTTADVATAAGMLLRDAWTGEASWTLNVRREDRHAVGTSAERYGLDRPGRHYDHTIGTENGTIVTDIRK